MSTRVLLWGSGCLLLGGGIGGTVVSLQQHEPELTVLSIIFMGIGFFLLIFLVCSHFEEKKRSKLPENYKTIAV